MAKIIIKLGDITCEDTEAIVNAANESLLGGGFEEAELLRSAYKNSFLSAKEENLKTIAIPAISTGVYGYLAVYQRLEKERQQAGYL